MFSSLLKREPVVLLIASVGDEAACQDQVPGELTVEGSTRTALCPWRGLRSIPGD